MFQAVQRMVMVLIGGDLICFVCNFILFFHSNLNSLNKLLTFNFFVCVFPFLFFPLFSVCIQRNVRQSFLLFRKKRSYGYFMIMFVKWLGRKNERKKQESSVKGNVYIVFFVHLLYLKLSLTFVPLPNDMFPTADILEISNLWDR